MGVGWCDEREALHSKAGVLCEAIGSSLGTQRASYLAGRQKGGGDATGQQKTLEADVPAGTRVTN